MRGFDLRQPRQQMREAVLHAEVLAIGSRVLADQVDLAHALRKHARGFGDDAIQNGGCGTCPDTAG